MVRLRMIHLEPDFSTPTRLVPMQPISSAQSIEDLLSSLPFEKRYLVEALLSHGTVTVPELPELLHALTRYRRDDQTIVLEGLFKWTRRASVKQDIRGTRFCWNSLNFSQSDSSTDVARRVIRSKLRTNHIDDHLVFTRRCLVTPTRCILNPPTAETSNEMLRDHEPYLDRFLRVQFVDDDGDFPVTGETLAIDDGVHGSEGVFARVRRAHSDGLVIAGRHYVFATFSESQARCVAVLHYCMLLPTILSGSAAAG